MVLSNTACYFERIYIFISNVNLVYKNIPIVIIIKYNVEFIIL